MARAKKEEQGPVVKRYACNRFPSYRLGEHVLFHRGYFETADPDIQALIEGNDWYGVHIHPIDLPAEEEA